MKKFFTKYTLTLLVLFIILTAGMGGNSGHIGMMESGGMWSNTGSPGDGNSCAECHTGGGATVDDTWLTTDIPDSMYSPGQTYIITLKGTYPMGTKKGFSVVCEDGANAPVGTFVITDAANTQLFNNHVSHKEAGNGMNTWICSWTAPSSGTGDVTFYASFLKDGYAGGVVTASSLFTEGVASVSELGPQPVLTLFPNPVSDLMHLELSDIGHETVSVSLLSITGQNVLSDRVAGSGNSFSKTYDLTQLDAGTYFVKIGTDNKIIGRKIIVNR